MVQNLELFFFKFQRNKKKICKYSPNLSLTRALVLRDSSQCKVVFFFSEIQYAVQHKPCVCVWCEYESSPY